uniref:O-methyltransferase n=1 Tax=Solanum tuberosum TaxID=4113 RepID=M0ZZ16_SOLTU
MASDARLVMTVLIQNGKGLIFEGLKSLVDVGGGTGTIAKAIADAFPQINCTVFDLPHVIEGLEGSKNLSFVGGDMFNSIPSANAILLKLYEDYRYIFKNFFLCYNSQTKVYQDEEESLKPV